MAYAQTDPPGAALDRGAESDIYHCLVFGSVQIKSALSLLFIACKSSELCCISAGSKLTNCLSGNRNDMWPSKISGHLFETLE